MKNEILAMDRFAIQGGKSVREYDKNGFLHVDLSPLTRVQVAPYRGCEIPGWESLGLDAMKVYKGYRSAEELTKPDTIKSMNGIPIQLDHNPDYADAPAKQTRVGSTGDKAHFDEPFLFNSLHIMDKVAIDRINDGSMRELSLAYRYRPDFTKGKAPNGEDYDFVMRDINANHLALVEQGRCGDQVLVYDSQMEQTMYEDDKSVPQPTDIAEDEGPSVDQLIQQLIDGGMPEDKAQAMRPQLEALANGGANQGGDNLPVEDEDDEDLDDFDDEDDFDDDDGAGDLEPPPMDDEPMDDKPIDDEPVEDEGDDFQPVDEADPESNSEPVDEPVDEPMDDKPIDEPVDDEPIDEPMDDDMGEDEDDDEGLDDEPSDEDGDDVEPEPSDEPPVPPQEPAPQQPPMQGGEMPQGGGAEQVVKDAMQACGLDGNDPNEARAFAAGVKFGEAEAAKQPQQPMQPQQPQQPQQNNPMAKDTNALVRKVEARMNAKFKAIKECEKTLGKVEPTAYDSAGSVYLDALKQEGIRVTGLDAKAARAAYRAFFAGKDKLQKKLAQDSKPQNESLVAKTLNKIKVGA